jgi:DNA-binding Lrp family transcriptional regulator
MDDTDRLLLTLIQRQFPISERPYAELAEKTGVTESEAIARIEAMREEGLIRRMGASLNPRALGYVSTLAAARVAPGKVVSAADYINSFSEVTHNYERDDAFNIWFTVIARDEEALAAIIDDIRNNSGADEVIDLPATHIFKIKVNFDLTK